MNLILEAKYKESLKIIKILKDYNIQISFIITDKKSFKTLRRISKVKKTKILSVYIDVTILNKKMIKKMNKVDRVFIEVNKELNNKEKYFLELILNYKKYILIIDKTKINKNLEFYERYKNIIYNQKILTNDIFSILTIGKPILQCIYTSCLGKNLYMNKKGDIHYCYYNLDNSFITNINEVKTLSEIFEKANFTKKLIDEIERRDRCKEQSNYFEYTKGGCPFNNQTINFFKKEHDIVLQKIKASVNDNTVFFDLTNFEKECIIKYKLKGRTNYE